MKRSRADAVSDYLNGQLRREEMTFAEETYMEQMMKVYHLMTEGHPKKFIRITMQEQYHLTYSAQYALEKDTDRVFGAFNKINRAIEQHIAVEMAKTSYQMALEKQQVGNMIKAQQALVKAIGDDPGETPDFEKIQPSLIVTALPEGMEQQIAYLLNQGHVNLNKAPIIEVEEIGFEDVED